MFNSNAQLPAQIGFLFLRYGCDPRELWDWYAPYVEDEEVLQAGQIVVEGF